MTEVQIKNLSRLHIHPNWMDAIIDSEVKKNIFKCQTTKA